MIFVSVGTFVHGFDALVEAADAAAERLACPGFAQIGKSTVEPRHLSWERFLDTAAMQAQLARARLVICHGGAGILGEAMRAGCRIIAVPRRGATSGSHPANDQSSFVAALAQRQPILVCPTPGQLEPILAAALALQAPPTYELGTDLPDLIAAFLSRDRPGRRTRGGG